MARERPPQCAACQTKVCRNGIDCLKDGDRHRELYGDPGLARLHRAASAIEARHYCREPRIREVMLFARELGARTVGLAFCVGLAEEAEEFLPLAAKIPIRVETELYGLDEANEALHALHGESVRGAKVLRVAATPD